MASIVVVTAETTAATTAATTVATDARTDATVRGEACEHMSCRRPSWTQGQVGLTRTASEASADPFGTEHPFERHTPKHRSAALRLDPTMHL
jgi:hypothetical protein